MNTHINHEQDDERTEAVRQAAAGAQAWRAVVHAQQSSTPDHADFYSLAGHLVDTLAAVEALARVLTRQVGRYAHGLGPGRRVYDDTRTADPHERLLGAALDLEPVAQYAGLAAQEVNRFWSAIGHIGVEDAPVPDAPADGEVSR